MQTDMDLKNVMAIKFGENNPLRNGNMSKDMFTLKASNKRFVVFGVTNGTSMPPKSTKTISESATQGTLLKSQLQTSQTLTSWWRVFLAKHLASLENVKDFRTPEVLSFLISLGFLPTKDPDIFYSKMSKVYLVMTKEKLSRQYLGFSPTWGMSINGRFLTAKTSESPRIGKECSLSDILEEKVDPKYFLSEKMVKFLIRNNNNQFVGRYKPVNRKTAVTVTSRYWKMGKTDNYIISEELKQKERNGSKMEKTTAETLVKDKGFTEQVV